MTTPSSEREALGRQSAFQRWELAVLPASANGIRTPQSDALSARRPSDLENELAALRAAAEGEGRAAGYEAGRAAATAEGIRLAALIATFAQSAGDHEQHLVDEVLDLALVLARQLVGEALSVRREFVLPIVSAALRQLPQSTQHIELRLNPADVAIVRGLLAAEALGPRCQIVEDSTVAPGGCLVDTEQCELDMSIPSRWRRLMATLGRSDDWLEPL